MAKLYLIAVDHNEVLKPTFQRVPPGLKVAAMDVMDLGDACNSDGDALLDKVREVAEVLRGAVPKPERVDDEPHYPPPVAPTLPLDAGTDPNDPDAWRNSIDNALL